MYASTKKGNKPDFHKSAPAQKGKELYDHFISNVRKQYQEDRVKDGVFQAMMDVGIVNDGPVGVDFRCIDEAVSLRLCLLVASCTILLPADPRRVLSWEDFMLTAFPGDDRNRDEPT